MKTEAEKRRAAFLLHLTAAEKAAFEAAAEKEGKKVAVWARDCLRVVVGLDAAPRAVVRVIQAEPVETNSDGIVTEARPTRIVSKEFIEPAAPPSVGVIRAPGGESRIGMMPPKIAEATGIPPIPIKDDGGPLAEVAPKTVIPAPAPAQPKRIFVDNGRPKGK